MDFGKKRGEVRDVGGFGSGRSGGRPTVETGLTLDFDMLRRKGQPAGSLHWSSGGRETASIGYRLDLGGECLTLNYVAGDTRERIEQRIHLTFTEPHFGGRRWWMLCPITHRRCLRLHSGWGYNRFASREALGLAYAVQNEDRLDRSLRRGRKALARLGGSGDLDEADDLPKPKWMRWSTYEREMAKARTASDAFDLALYERFGAELGALHGARNADLLPAGHD